MKIAYFIPEFPSISQTFVLKQIVGLIDLGNDVEIFAEKRIHVKKKHELLQKYRLDEKTVYYNEFFEQRPRNFIFRLLLCIRYSLFFLWRDPYPILKALNIYKYGKDALSLRLLYKIIPLLGKGPYDVIHCHFGPSGNKVLLFRKFGLLSGLLVTTFHGYDITEYPQRKGDNVYTDLFQKGDLFLPISNRWADLLIRMGCDKRKIKVHRMGVEIGKNDPHSRSRANDGMVTILTIARLVEKKGVEDGIKAFCKIMKDCNAIYLIAGDGPLKEYLTQLIIDYKAQDRICMLGWQKDEEIEDLLSRADILLAPSVTGDNGDQEGIPVVIMEAFARKIPVLSTFHSGIPELVENTKSGFLVQEHDIDDLSSKLKTLINDINLRHEMGSYGYDIVSRDFNIHHLDRALNDLFLKMSSEKSQQ